MSVALWRGTWAGASVTVMTTSAVLVPPEASNTVEKPDNDAQTVLHVDAAGRFYVDNVPVDPSGASPGGAVPGVNVAAAPSRLQQARLRGIRAATQACQRAAISHSRHSVDCY